MIGRVYKITSPNTDKIYIGSTRRSLKRRFIEHICGKTKYTSRIILGYGDPNIELLEEVKFEDKKELLLCEKKHIDLHKNICVNYKSALGVTLTSTEATRKYRDKHSEKVKKARNAKTECPCGGKYTRDNKNVHFRTSKHKNYISSNK